MKEYCITQHFLRFNQVFVAPSPPIEGFTLQRIKYDVGHVDPNVEGVSVICFWEKDFDNQSSVKVVEQVTGPSYTDTLWIKFVGIFGFEEVNEFTSKQMSYDFSKANSIRQELKHCISKSVQILNPNA